MRYSIHFDYKLLKLLALIMLQSHSVIGETSPASRPTVVELFTSQGCSSCPPADALLGELTGRADVIALAFHVDYWDDLGWRDRFAIPEAVQRQRQYVQTLQLSTAFTPQAVIDGRRSLVGSDRHGMTTLVESPHDGIPIYLTIANNNLFIDLSEREDHSPLEVNAVAFLPKASTQIGRGENTGRKLDEFNIVRAFKPLGVWRGQNKKFHLPLSALPPDATRVAVLIQQPEQGAIVGAAVVTLR